MFRRCASTVRGLTKSSDATSLDVAPWPTRRAMCNSGGVSSSMVSAVLRRARSRSRGAPAGRVRRSRRRPSPRTDRARLAGGLGRRVAVPRGAATRRRAAAPGPRRSRLRLDPGSRWARAAAPRCATPRAIELNQVLDLDHVHWPLDNGNPVLISEADTTSFTFLTLPGHFRGPGRTIQFAILGRGGRLILRQVGATSPRISDLACDGGAWFSWRTQAATLRTALVDVPGARSLVANRPRRT